MNKKEKKLERAKIILLVVIAILLLLNLFEKKGVIESIQNTSKKILNNGEIVISEDGVMSKTVDSSSWDTNKVTAVTDSDGNVVPVPKGYVGSNVTGENKVNEGYVIYEGTEAVTSSNVSSARTSRNQWVWVPVKYPDRIYEEVNGVKKAKLYGYSTSGRFEHKNNNLEPAILPEWDNSTNLSNNGLTGMTADKLYQELQLEFDETMNSIEKYGGFYIGRYETGNLSQEKPIVRKMNADINNQNWCTCYSKMGYLSANENVKTNMIWGCLWDEIMQWMFERQFRCYRDYGLSSNLWGNFADSSFSHLTITSGTVVKNANTSRMIPTGSTEYTNSLNIYDLAGNVSEWTLESSGTCGRIFRGGNYANSMSQNLMMQARMGNLLPNLKTESIGVRAYLYIK